MTGHDMTEARANAAAAAVRLAEAWEGFWWAVNKLREATAADRAAREARKDS